MRDVARSLTLCVRSMLVGSACQGSVQPAAIQIRANYLNV